MQREEVDSQRVLKTISFGKNKVSQELNKYNNTLELLETTTYERDK